MTNYVHRVRKILHSIPGERYLKEYRFLPLFFVAGAGLEFVMIKLHVGEVNFYKTYKKRLVENLVQARLAESEA